MDIQRAILAIIISFIILLGYQYYFMPAAPPGRTGQQRTQGNAVNPGAVQQEKDAPAPTAAAPSVPAAPAPAMPVQTVQPVAVNPDARDIKVETPLYTAIFFEQGGGLKSFVLKKYRTAKAEDAPSM
ncbi:MAG: hypothetical protein D3904_08835, partial [Candidatus Electrothrix sp. EH2]|nr:hypothetical protein [Candidatus Electrothrix sp. EH2]